MILLIRSSRKEKIIDDNFHGAIIIKIVINLAEGEAGGKMLWSSRRTESSHRYAAM